MGDRGWCSLSPSPIPHPPSPDCVVIEKVDCQLVAAPREALPQILPTALRIGRTPLKDLGIQIRGEDGHRPKHKLELGAHEARPIVLDAEVPDEDFTLRVLDVVQTNRDGSRDGARVMLVTAPKDLLAPPRQGA